MVARAQPELHRQAEFWDARARDYPDVLDPGRARLQRRRMQFVPPEARPAAGTRLLDVGAGTGAVSVPAADHGAAVTALDLSASMLARLASAAGPLRIETVVADWRDLDVDAVGWRAAFDLVYAQMVPSLRRPADFERMQACCRGWCVFIGWGRARHDPWLEAAFDAHDVPWEVPSGVPLAAECLGALGRIVHPVYWRETWKRDRSASAALRDAADHLQVRGATVQPDRLQALAQRRCVGDRIVDAAEVEIGCIAWPVGGRATVRAPSA